ncbi:MAG TPA: (d)CMP kinase [Gemmataceae bacterium]|nr:(d)CMP kinase [Gemmataceae bacterium]
MIITIDGPAGAGKSSAARTLAQRLGFEFLDTGAMYRAVALAALRAGVNQRDEQAVERLVASLPLEMPPGGRVLLDGEDVTDLIRTSEVTAATGAVADSPAVRRRLAQMQRTIAEGRNMVCEGRDQGTIVFPDAVCKFFMFADPLERARRRQRQMEARGERLDLEQILRDQEIRDQRDAARDLAPMKPASDAVLLDSTQLSLEQAVETMTAEVRRRMSSVS